MINRLLILFMTLVGASIYFVGGEITLVLRVLGYVAISLTAIIAWICDVRDKND